MNHVLPGWCSLSLQDMRASLLKGTIYYSAVNKSSSLEASSHVFFPLVSFSVFIFIAWENGSMLAMKPHFCTDSDTANEQNHTSCANVIWGFLMAKTRSDPAVGINI